MTDGQKEVRQTTMVLSATLSKSFMWGPLLGIVSTCFPAIIWVECGPPTGCSPEVIRYLMEQPAVTVIAMGDEAYVRALRAALEASEERVRQRRSQFNFCVDSANWSLGPIESYRKDQVFMALILTPALKLKPHRILDYCLYIMNFHAKDFNQHFI